MLTVGRWAWAAYLSVWSVEFVLRASPSAFAPSGPTWLLKRLQTRVESRRQGVLTLVSLMWLLIEAGKSKHAAGGVLQCLE